MPLFFSNAFFSGAFCCCNFSLCSLCMHISEFAHPHPLHSPQRCHHAQGATSQTHPRPCWKESIFLGRCVERSRAAVSCDVCSWRKRARKSPSVCRYRGGRVPGVITTHGHLTRRSRRASPTVDDHPRRGSRHWPYALHCIPNHCFSRSNHCNRLPQVRSSMSMPTSSESQRKLP
jgi:hypothetical protein